MVRLSVKNPHRWITATCPILGYEYDKLDNYFVYAYGSIKNPPHASKRVTEEFILACPELLSEDKSEVLIEKYIENILQDSEDNEEVQYWKDYDDIEDDPVDLTLSMFPKPKNPSDPHYNSNFIRREYHPSRTTHPTWRDLIIAYHTTTQRCTECSKNTYHVATFPVQKPLLDLTTLHLRTQWTQCL